jgi:hypothetical protein
MEALTEGQKQNNVFQKNGNITKEGDKKLYAPQIEKAEQENKEKILDKKTLEIIGRKFIEEFKDEKIHQNVFGNSNDYVDLGRVIANKEKIMLNNNLAQLIARKYLLNSAPKLMPSLNKEEIQTKAILSQSDHNVHNLDNKQGFNEFGDKKFYIELPIGALFKGKLKEVNSPDGIFIDFSKSNVKFYFVELKSNSIYLSGNSLSDSGKYLKKFLGNNVISKLNRIGVTNSSNIEVENFKKNEKISNNAQLFTTKEFSKFIQGAIFIRGVRAENFESLGNNKTLKKMFELLHKVNKAKDFKENVNEFKNYINSLNSENFSVETKYFNY